MNPISSLQAGQTASAGAPATAPLPKEAVNKQMFLQLLVAQIKNQNPLNPADGVQFLTQLAQFTEMEQTFNMRQEIAQMRADLKDAAAQLEAAIRAAGKAADGNTAAQSGGRP